MTELDLIGDLREMLTEGMPLAGHGETCQRFRQLIKIGRRNLSLARLAEAHFDAVAILAEAARVPAVQSIYGVWASEIPGKSLELIDVNGKLLLRGTKMFCSGARLIDRALITVTKPTHRLVEVDLKTSQTTILIDESSWRTKAFEQTRTATVTFVDTPVVEADLIGPEGWYLERPGFWHGACCPAACWAGGAEGLVDYASAKDRQDPHTLAHLAAMQASVWAMKSIFENAGNEIDKKPYDIAAAHRLALIVRHLIEQACSDVLRRFSRAYGPYPLSMQEDIVNRFQELELYIRQSHGERDLEALAKLSIKS